LLENYWKKNKQILIKNTNNLELYSVGLYKRKPIVEILLRPTASSIISSSGGASSVAKRNGYFNWPPVASVRTSTQSILK